MESKNLNVLNKTYWWYNIGYKEIAVEIYRNIVRRAKRYHCENDGSLTVVWIDTPCVLRIIPIFDRVGWFKRKIGGFMLVQYKKPNSLSNENASYYVWVQSTCGAITDKDIVYKKESLKTISDWIKSQNFKNESLFTLV